MLPVPYCCDARNRLAPGSLHLEIRPLQRDACKTTFPMLRGERLDGVRAVQQIPARETTADWNNRDGFGTSECAHGRGGALVHHPAVAQEARAHDERRAIVVTRGGTGPPLRDRRSPGAPATNVATAAMARTGRRVRHSARRRSAASARRRDRSASWYSVRRRSRSISRLTRSPAVARRRAGSPHAASAMSCRSIGSGTSLSQPGASGFRKSPATI